MSKIVHGYDPSTKSLFKWDKDFSYLGRTDEPPPDADVIIDNAGARIECEFISTFYLGGKARPIGIYWSDGTEFVYSVMTVKDGSFAMLPMVTVQEENLRTVSEGTVYLCGPICSDPAKVASFCRKIDVKFVSPLGKDAGALGLTILKAPDLVPRRLDLSKISTVELDSENLAFDPSMPNDAVGNMAYLVSQGISVVNEIRTSPGISPFYGKIITDKIIGDPVFMLDCPVVDKYFPAEKLSVKAYAATSVPVEVENTGAFRKATGYTGGKAKILVATSYQTGYQTFMQSYNIHSGKHWVALLDTKKMKPSAPVPVFRHNKAYRMSPEAYKLKYHELA